MERTLKCIRCGKEYPIDEIRYTCDCGGLLEVKIQDLPGPEILKTWDSRLGSKKAVDQSGVWRYREFVFDARNPVTYPEGRTNLYHLPSNIAGMEELYAKHEGENPTGSFKDRGMTVGISFAKELGLKAVACASTGNTSASMAAYAARAGLKAIVFLPRGKVAAGKLAQALAYGATIFQINGDFDDAMRIVIKISQEMGIYLLNSMNPIRLEGQKTIVIDILSQLNWEPPDWIVLPGGNLGNTSAFGKALKELKEAGIINKIPRLATIQADGAAPFYKSFIDNFKKFTPLKAETVATAIRIGNPVNFEKAKASIVFTNGVVESVSDVEILEAKADLDAAGIGCEPASAASLAGLRKLLKRGIISPDQKVVLILTGNLLKDPEIVKKMHTGEIESFREKFKNQIINVDPNLDDIKEKLEQILERQP